MKWSEAILVGPALVLILALCYYLPQINESLQKLSSPPAYLYQIYCDEDSIRVKDNKETILSIGAEDTTSQLGKMVYKDNQ